MGHLTNFHMGPVIDPVATAEARKKDEKAPAVFHDVLMVQERCDDFNALVRPVTDDDKKSAEYQHWLAEQEHEKQYKEWLAAKEKSHKVVELTEEIKESKDEKHKEKHQEVS